MKRIRNLVFALIAFLFLVACQPTPSTEAVVNKADGEFLEAIAATAVPSQSYAACEKWVEEFHDGNLNCHFNADIIMPVSPSYPVFHVARRTVDSLVLEDFLDYFLDQPQRAYETTRTAEDIKEELEAVARGAVDYRDGAIVYEPFEGQEDRIAALQEELRNVPENMIYFDPESLDLAMRPFRYSFEQSDSTVWQVNATDSALFASKFHLGIMQLQSLVAAGDAYPGEPVGTIIDVPFEQSRAEECALQAAREIGATNMGIANIEAARIIRRYTYEIMSVGWLVTLCRTDGDSLPIDINRMSFAGALQYEPCEFMAPWRPEALTMYIDENGIGWVSWENPIRIVSTANENVTLLPFDQIQEKARNIIKYGTKWTENSDQRYIDITVNSLTLTNTLMRTDNSVDQAVLAPMWLIEYVDNDDATGIPTIIALNAIDGTRVDPVMSMMAVPTA